MDLLFHSAVDSDRFGMRIFRASLPEIESDAILATILHENVDIAIVRFPSEKQYTLHHLDAIGIPFIVADTLVYYQADLQSCSKQKLRNDDLVFAECTASDRGTLDRLVQEIFVDYTNHYFSNPLLPKDKIVEGYQEWARDYAGRQFEGRTAWVVKKSGQAIAFVTCRFEQDECEIILNGVKPSESGKGVYGDIIRFTQGYFKDRNFSRIKISTQAQNYAVQKVWTQHQFFLLRSYVTVHINSLLGIAKHDLACVDVRFTEKNGPLRSTSGPPDVIGEINRYTASIYAGYSVHLLRCISLQPLSIDRNYQCHFSQPIQTSTSGLHKSVVRLMDEGGGVCGLLYLDLYGSAS